MVFRMNECCKTASGSSKGHDGEVECVGFTVNVLLTHFGSVLQSRYKPTLVHGRSSHKY